MAAGTKPADIVKELRVQPFRAQKLTEQASTWGQEELDDALGELYELDLLSKGIANDGSPRSMSDEKIAARRAGMDKRPRQPEEDGWRGRWAGWPELGVWIRSSRRWTRPRQ